MFGETSTFLVILCCEQKKKSPDDHNSLAQSYQAYDPSPVVVLLAT